MMKLFFSNACWPQLLAPLEIIMSKIYLKYIHMFFFLAYQGDYEHDIVQHDFVPHYYKYEEHRSQISLIIHHKE